MADTTFFYPSSAITAEMGTKTKPSLRVSVIIPTFRRAEGLGRALASVAAQASAPDVTVDIIVCDNSPEASAREQVIAFGVSSPLTVTFVHEPNPGVANARNSAVAACFADFIAFLDDDEEAPGDWLKSLLATQRAFDADVVFGPVTARLPDPSGARPATKFDPYFNTFFSRRGAARDTRLGAYYGCGNSLIRRACLPAHEPFSVVQNNMGGEDDRLFHGLLQRGAVMAWAAEAAVFEDVPAHRATLGYTLRRAFAYGQGPSYTAALDGKRLTCAAWMAQGVIQMLVFGLWGGILLALGAGTAAAKLDKAARGFGKLLWFPPFKIGFYGTALLKPAER
jgi:cellulose synthase/poly-beta-1,6-N-acetylglucosamine synthase-like glycosyltransferase